MITIQEYTLSDLAKRLESGSLWSGEVIPITKQRISSQIRNPRAQPDDVGLLVAYDDERVVGYIGVLPDLVFLGGIPQRIGWLTAWWADPSPKYGGIGFQLMARASRFYQGAVGASRFSDDARKAYQASKMFVTVKESAGLEAFIRANTREIVPRRVVALKKAEPILAICDYLINIVCNARLRWWTWYYGIGEEFRLEYLAEVDTEAAEFIGKFQNRELNRRGPSELNWIVKHPWVLASPLGQGAGKGFFFSNTSEESDFFMFKVFDSEGVMIGFAMLRVINGRLTVPYCYMQSQHADAMFRVIAEHAIKLRANTLTLYLPELRESLVRQRFPTWLKVTRASSWIVGRVCTTKLVADLEVQDGDGDCAFC